MCGLWRGLGVLVVTLLGLLMPELHASNPDPSDPGVEPPTPRSWVSSLDHWASPTLRSHLLWRPRQGGGAAGPENKPKRLGARTNLMSGVWGSNLCIGTPCVHSHKAVSLTPPVNPHLT